MILGQPFAHVLRSCGGGIAIEGAQKQKIPLDSALFWYSIYLLDWIGVLINVLMYLVMFIWLTLVRFAELFHDIAVYELLAPNIHHPFQIKTYIVYMIFEVGRLFDL